jgi:hypothetical protein
MNNPDTRDISEDETVLCERVCVLADATVVDEATKMNWGLAREELLEIAKEEGLLDDEESVKGQPLTNEEPLLPRSMPQPRRAQRTPSLPQQLALATGICLVLSSGVGMCLDAAKAVVEPDGHSKVGRQCPTGLIPGQWRYEGGGKVLRSLMGRQFVNVQIGGQQSSFLGENLWSGCAPAGLSVNTVVTVELPSQGRGTYTFVPVYSK